MPLRDDLLNPIPGPNPSGANLRYAPVYDKIKEARREDDDAPQGEWRRERKTADWNLVIKLAGEAIATQSKDLQLAAWLAEALLKKEGFGGLLAGLLLLRGLLENFWDTLYPEAEDGDLEMRAAPLDWAGTKLDDAVRKTPLTRSGLNFFHFKESRSVGYEADAEASESKREQRDTAVQEGKITGEEFDAAFGSTPAEFYQQATEDLRDSLEALDALAELCESKFGEFAPGFSRLKSALEEVRHTANGLLRTKREQSGEPDDSAPAEEPGETVSAGAGPEYEPQPVAAYGQTSAAAAAPARAKRKAVAGLAPADAEEAAERLAAVARYLREQDASNPAPYLILRGYRWGELRAGGSSPDASLFEAPSGEVRQQLKRASGESNWAEVIELGEAAMGQACGRAWLDLQRYVVSACDELGYYPVSAAIGSGLKALLADYPELPSWTLLDDTATANAQTQAWLKQFQAQGAVVGTLAAGSLAAETLPAAALLDEPAHEADSGEPKPPDAFELAMDAARSGNTDQAIEILAGDIARQGSGRARFQRKLQLAQLCLSMGQENVALPILEELAARIDEHKLEDWESPDVVAHPLALLYRCLGKEEADAQLRRKLYAKICRLDPVQALKVTG